MDGSLPLTPFAEKFISVSTVYICFFILCNVLCWFIIKSTRFIIKKISLYKIDKRKRINMWKMQIEKMETLCYHMKKFWIIILIVTVQPLIYYIRKLDSKLSVAAMQLVFTSFHKWKAIPPKKQVNNTLSKLMYYWLIFFWLNCYY